MESSETRQKAIRLAEQLLKCLSEAEAADVMSRWIVYFIAEQMNIAQNAIGAEKAAAEDRCFDSILRLWDHRAHLPQGQRPFEDFEPILRALDRLDPEQSGGFYHRFSATDHELEPGSVDALVEFIIRADYAARVLIELGLVTAIDKATTDKTRTILRDAIFPARDVEVIARLVELHDQFDAEGHDATKRLLDRLRDRLDRLDQFTTACRSARIGFEKELRRLEALLKSSKPSASPKNKSSAE